MRQPRFWFKQNSFWQKRLAPLGWFYGWSVRRRLAKSHPYKSQKKVICVGNICVGGTGKTPLSLFIAQQLIKRGYKVAFLNHGYKSQKQNIWVDVAHPEGVSDEALLLANIAPTVVNKDRAEGMALLDKSDAQVVIMDDGFQNPSVAKDFSVLVFNGQKGIGNGLCLPVGPLREPLEQGLPRAQSVVIIGKDQTGLKKKIHRLAPKMPVFEAQLVPTISLNKQTGIAFAGIGYPEKFFEQLRAMGVTLTRTVRFPDHYQYKDSDIERLLAYGCPLFTTQKDLVKIAPKYHNKITAVPVQIQISSDFVQLVEKQL